MLEFKVRKREENEIKKIGHSGAFKPARGIVNVRVYNTAKSLGVAVVIKHSGLVVMWYKAFAYPEGLWMSFQITCISFKTALRSLSSVTFLESRIANSRRVFPSLLRWKSYEGFRLGYKWLCIENALERTRQETEGSSPADSVRKQSWRDCNWLPHICERGWNQFSLHKYRRERTFQYHDATC